MIAGMVGACIMGAPAARDDCSELMGDCEMSLRNQIFAAGVLAALAATLWLGASASAQQDASSAHAAAQPPNIVYIVSDDQGWKDVGYHGSDILTPNIDALAKGGARLEQFYAQPMCTPTRAALMTGRYPSRYGLRPPSFRRATLMASRPTNGFLPQALKEAGYETAIVGKWHLGHADPKYWPRQRGFDHQYGPLIGEIDYFTHERHGVLDWYRDNKPVGSPAIRRRCWETMQ